MKYISIVFLTIGLSLSSTFGYTPNQEDTAFLDQAQERIEQGMIEDLDHLLSLHKQLDQLIVRMRIHQKHRYVYLLEQVQSMLIDTVFNQDDICISDHAQLGDTTEVSYTTQNYNSTVYFETDTSLAYNPGTPHLRKDLSYNILGGTVGKSTSRSIPSYPLSTDDARNTLISKSKQQLQQIKEPAVGMHYIFGSTKLSGVVTAQVVVIDGDTVLLDFSKSAEYPDVYLTITLDALRKGCQ